MLEVVPTIEEPRLIHGGHLTHFIDQAFLVNHFIQTYLVVTSLGVGHCSDLVVYPDGFYVISDQGEPGVVLLVVPQQRERRVDLLQFDEWISQEHHI